MTAPPPPGRPAGADVAAISDWVRRIHGPDPVDLYEDGTQACIACHEPHPCIETLLADAYDSLRAERDEREQRARRLRDDVHELVSEVGALRARAERAEAAQAELAYALGTLVCNAGGYDKSIVRALALMIGPDAPEYQRLAAKRVLETEFSAGQTFDRFAAPTEPEGAA